MKAAVYKQYGAADVVTIKDVIRPEIRDNEILVQVYATSVTTADWRLRASAFPGVMWLPGRLMFGLFAPRQKVLGSEFAGRVVSRGKGVTRFALGDSVFGFAKAGAHAEYLAIAEDGAVAGKPASLGFDEAAAVPFGALSALVFLRDFAKVQPGQSVLINGASGGVGVYAVQIAKYLGAEVTAVCSTVNMDLVASLGADHVIDYTRENFADSGKTYDLILDPVGKTTFAGCRKALRPNGIYLPLEFGLREIGQALVTSRLGGRKVVIGVSGDTQEDLAMIRELLERGVIRPVVDSHFPLEEIADAHRRVEGRHKVGGVVVTVAEPQVHLIAA